MFDYLICVVMQNFYANVLLSCEIFLTFLSKLSFSGLFTFLNYVYSLKL